MRLNSGVLLKSPQITNPLGEREIDLRHNAISHLDESVLAGLNDDFDVINLGDNLIIVLEGFPPMKRLTTLILHRNHRLLRLSPLLPSRLLNLHTLVANACGFDSFSSLFVLSGFKSLLRVSFIGNPIVDLGIRHLRPQPAELSQDESDSISNNKDNGDKTTSSSSSLPYSTLEKMSPYKIYRLFLITICPTLKLIDFNRVLDVERREAKAHRDSLLHLVNAKRVNQTLTVNSLPLSLTDSTTSTLLDDVSENYEVRKVRSRGRNAVGNGNNAVKVTTGESLKPSLTSINEENISSLPLETEEEVDEQIIKLSEQLENASTVEETDELEEKLNYLSRRKSEIQTMSSLNKRKRIDH